MSEWSPTPASRADHQRVVALLAELLELPAPEREAHLRGAVGTDLTLEQEVRSLLRAAERAGGFLSQGDVPAARSGDPLRSGDVLGRYTLIERLGEGGMGTVFRALQRAPVVREVAIKVIREGHDSEQVLARFDAESQTLAIMDHPSIARVFDGGATPSGRPYFVMELVDGVPITEHCDTHGLDIRARLQLFRQVCLAVQHAHTKGIVHRDLKPGNVLVTVVDGAPVPKVIDFGIAKATTQAPLAAGVTQVWQRVGTPEYMSPEQASDNTIDVDTRSDIYSLGVLLYQLLTGGTPLGTDELSEQPWGEVERIIREVEPPTPSSRVATKSSSQAAAQRASAPRELAANLRGDLDWIVMRCLEKERERRYQTAEALAADVAHHLAGEPIAAAPPSRLYRWRKLARRHRVAVASGALLIGSLALGVVGTSVGMLRADTRRREAEVALRDADGLATFLQEMLGSVQASVALGRDTALLREIVDRAAQSLDEGALAASPDAVVRLKRTLGTTYADVAAFDEAERMLTDALSLARGRAPLDEVSLATSLEDLASFIALHLRDFARAEPLAREALALRRAARGGDERALAASVHTLAGVLEGAGALDEAEALHAEALEMRRRLNASRADALELVTALHGMAGILDVRGRPMDAEARYREALALCEGAVEGDHPRLASELNNLAGVLENLDRAAEAEPMYLRALEMRRRLHGGDHPEVFVSLNNMAYILQVLGRLDEVEPYYAEALAMARRLFPADHPFVLSAVSNMAGFLMTAGKPADAEPLFKEVLERRRAQFPAPHRSLALSVTNYGTVLVQLKRRAEAEPYFREAAALFEAVHGPDHHDTARAKSSLAATLVKLDRAAEAEPLYVAALAVYERTFPGDHSRTATLLGLMAQCYEALERKDEALQLAQRATDMSTRLFGADHSETEKARAILTRLQREPGER
ncbi:MAG: serine/threonine-protein kinase [Planctomycetota bacterium]